jgi:hypothetical protein
VRAACCGFCCCAHLCSRRRGPTGVRPEAWRRSAA